MAKVACLTVTHESAHAIEAFLDGFERLRAGTSHDVRLIVVDNASKDGTVAHLRERGVEVHQAGENLGWGAGNNIAFKQVDPGTDAVLLLNPDIIVPPAALDALLGALEPASEDAAAKVGAAVPAIRQGDEVRAAAAPDYGVLDALFGGFGLRRLRVRALERRLRVDRPTRLKHAYGEGGCLLLRRETLVRLSPLCEDLFVFFDDVDLGRRLAGLGLHTAYVPAAVALELPGKGSRAAPGGTEGDEKLARYLLYLTAELTYYARWWGRGFARWIARQRAVVDLPLLEGRWRRRFQIVGIKVRGRAVVREFLDAPGRPTLLVISQVYVPDPASLGQHMADAADALAARGKRVVVLTSSRGYDDADIVYPAREFHGGVEIRRLPLASFGKGSIPRRLVGATSFLGQALVRGLFTRDLRAVLVSTSPPMASFAALWLSWLRGTPIVYWSMDVNPDQAIALGRVRADSLSARVFEASNRLVLRRARRVIALDPSMAARLSAKQDLGDRLRILPPWPHEDVLDLASADPQGFRARHGLVDRFVVMYSGNHSLAHPLDTILDAAKRLEDRKDVVFVFVGGGKGKQAIEDAISAGASNLRSLPYQPLAELGGSLGAADLHLVVFGDEMLGIVHPCKAYGAMAVGRPLFLIGPAASATALLIARYELGWRVDHGDAKGAEALIRGLLDRPPEELRAIGRRGTVAIQADLSRAALCGAFRDVVLEAMDDTYGAPV